MTRRFSAATVLIVLSVAAVPAVEPFRYPEGKHGTGTLRYVNGIPVVTVYGTPDQIGAAIGVLSKPAAEGVTGYFDNMLKRTKLDIAWPWLVKTSEAMLPQFPPDHRAEIEAAVKASGLPRDKIVVGNCLWDIKKLGCSTLFAGPSRSSTGQSLLGRNMDFPTLGVLQQYSLVIVCRPNNKHPFASVALPGLAGVLSGMNDRGLCVATLDVGATADGAPKFDLTGTPMMLTFRRILEECATVAEAEALLKSVKRTTLLNLTVCDASGAGVVFELTPKTVGVRKADNGLSSCTNHFRVSGLATDLRCDRFNQLEKSRGLAKLGLPEIQQRLHAANQGAETMQTMIFEPEARLLHLALGNGPTSAKPLARLDLRQLFDDITGP